MESSKKMKSKKSFVELPKMPNDESRLPIDSEVPLDMVQGLYVLRLVDEGVSVDTAMDLILSGILRPN